MELRVDDFDIEENAVRKGQDLFLKELIAELPGGFYGYMYIVIFQDSGDPGEIGGMGKRLPSGIGDSPAGGLIERMIPEQYCSQIAGFIVFPNVFHGPAIAFHRTVATVQAFLRMVKHLCLIRPGFRVMTPGTVQRAALEKNNTANPLPIRKRALIDIEDQRLHSFMRQ